MRNDVAATPHPKGNHVRANHDRPGPGTGPRLRLLRTGGIALALLVMLGLLYPEPLLQGRVFGSSDAENAALFTIVGDASLARGVYPQWNPYLFAGMPTFGSLAYTRFVYPPGEVLTFLQDHLGFPPLTWMLAHLLFGGAGMVWLLGRWGLPLPARLLGAAVWLLQPNVVAWGVHGHGSKLVTAMYLPWVVGVCLDLLEGKGRRRAALLALAVGLQVLRGHPQILYYTLLCVGVLLLGKWIAVLAARRRRADGAQRWPWRPTAAIGVALVTAFLIGAVQLLPTRDYAGWSVRGSAEGGGASYEYATGWSLHPREFPTLVQPAAAGFGLGTYQGFMPFTDYPNYFGWLLLTLAALGAWAAPRWPQRALAAIAVLSLLVACGRFFPVLYGPLYHLLPYFNKFRIPVMILAVTGFALAVLAAHGLAALHGAAAGARAPRRLAWVWLGLGAASLLGALGPGKGLHASQLASLAAAAGRGAPAPEALAAAWSLQQADLLRIGLLLVAAGAATVFAARRTPARRAWWPWVLLALVAVDLLGVAGRITHPERGLQQLARRADGGASLVPAGDLVRQAAPRATFRADPFLVEVAQFVGHERVWPLGSLAQHNGGMPAGLRSLGGYQAAKPAAAEAARARVLDPSHPAGRVAAWLGGRYLMLDGLLPPQALPALAELGADIEAGPVMAGDSTLYRNLSALPRARLVGEWAPVSGDLAGFLDRLQAGREPVARRVLLDRAPSPAPVAVAQALPAVAYVRDELNEVVLRAAPPAPSVLVLADLWLPGWSVTVDGAPATLLVADHMLRAVALPAGEHEVRFVYRDPALRRGLALTVCGVVLLLALAVAGSVPALRRRFAGGTEGEA
ncbi:MAG: hypothetical protein IPM94_02200 [bacterium]|nr:hypothetical protein [bacterium]